MKKTHFNDGTYTIIGAYYEVFNHTSRTFPEYIYEAAMIEKTRQRGVSITRQDKHEITYKHVRVGWQQLDLFVGDEIVVENKFPVAIGNIEDIHLDNLKQWLALSNVHLGILANFDAVRLEILFIRA